MTTTAPSAEAVAAARVLLSQIGIAPADLVTEWPGRRLDEPLKAELEEIAPGAPSGRRTRNHGSEGRGRALGAGLDGRRSGRAAWIHPGVARTGARQCGIR